MAAKREKRRFALGAPRVLAGLQGLGGASGAEPNRRFPWIGALDALVGPGTGGGHLVDGAKVWRS
jgi:hypothetical protein